jgi:hypothetical protein
VGHPYPPDGGREVGCCRSQAWADIKRLRVHWLERAKATFAERQAEELARIAQVEATAWARGDLRCSAWR